MDLDCLANDQTEKIKNTIHRKNLFTYKYQHEYQRHILQGRLLPARGISVTPLNKLKE